MQKQRAYMPHTKLWLLYPHFTKFKIYFLFVTMGNPLIRARTDLAHIYIKEAERKTKEAKEAYHKSITTKDGRERADAVWRERQSSLFAILFSAFALEAHINRIGYDMLGEETFNLVKLLKLENKWLLFPKLLKGKTFDENSQLFKDFKKLIELRNKFVHYKMYAYKELVEHPSGVKVPGIYEDTNAEKAEFAYEVAKKMILELDELLGIKWGENNL